MMNVSDWYQDVVRSYEKWRLLFGEVKVVMNMMRANFAVFPL